MCARITLRRSQLLLDFAARVQQPLSANQPRFNITPSQKVPVVRVKATGERAISAVEWGLIPHWSKPHPTTRPFNARSDKVAVSGMYRQAFDRRRCVVPTDGYYEWSGEKPPRQPYFVRFKDDRAFGLAGLWERWQDGPEAEPLDTFTIITTDPNSVVSAFHHRMPVILKPSDYDRWLDRNVPGADVAGLLIPFDSGEMEGYKVSTKINNVRLDDASLIEPV